MINTKMTAEANVYFLFYFFTSRQPKVLEDLVEFLKVLKLFSLMLHYPLPNPNWPPWNFFFLIYQQSVAISLSSIFWFIIFVLFIFLLLLLLLFLAHWHQYFNILIYYFCPLYFSTSSSSSSFLAHGHQYFSESVECTDDEGACIIYHLLINSI